MSKLLMIADDFTGALDTGVQCAARGAKTLVVTDPAYDFSGIDPELQVLVLDGETRHLPPQEAYEVVFGAVKRALGAGFTHIYKKTDSALRGNIGSELTAVLDAAGGEELHFFPAFPKLDRVTVGGVHYIGGTPVAESVFGEDPFEPVRLSSVPEIIHAQSEVPVTVCSLSGGEERAHGIHVYDARTDEDLLRWGKGLGREGLRLSAGCAGFASVLSQVLGFQGGAAERPELPPELFVLCGSINPVTLQQIRTAQSQGFPYACLTPEQRLEPSWLDSPACDAAVQSWLEQSKQSGRFVLSANDPDRCGEQASAPESALTVEQLRIRISTQLGQLGKRLLEGGLDATILCTGGDTLLALMRAVGTSQLTPVCELETGVVLTAFPFGGRTCYILSKSGGFGKPELFCTLAETLRT